MSDVSIQSETETLESYEKALEYWNSVSCNVNGMLGGFEQLNFPDINGSRNFLMSLKSLKFLLNDSVALDCGSGIGRVTKHLLLPLFKRVDMIDFSDNFIENSRNYIGEHDFKRIGLQLSKSLHVFEPSPNTYDLIWIQWVTGHLTDKDFVNFLKRCLIALKSGGCIVIKDNISSDKKEFDSKDYSWTRPKDDFYSIFQKANAEVLIDRKQLNFPKGIYEVRMFALRPDSQKKECDPYSTDENNALKKFENNDKTNNRNVNVLNDVSKTLNNI